MMVNIWLVYGYYMVIKCLIWINQYGLMYGQWLIEWGFRKWGDPIYNIRENPDLKWMIWGSPHFRNHPKAALFIGGRMGYQWNMNMNM